MTDHVNGSDDDGAADRRRRQRAEDEERARNHKKGDGRRGGSMQDRAQEAGEENHASILVRWARQAMKEEPNLWYDVVIGSWMRYAWGFWRPVTKEQAAGFLYHVVPGLASSRPIWLPLPTRPDGKPSEDELWLRKAERSLVSFTKDLLSVMQGLMAGDGPISTRARPDIFVCGNCTLVADKANGVIRARPHARDDYAMRGCRTEFHREARSEALDRFLDDISGGRDEPGVWRQSLMEALSAVLHGRGWGEVFYEMVGGGANGKSTLINFLLHVLEGPGGSEGMGVTANPLTFAASKANESGMSATPHLARLRGMRLVAVPEAASTAGDKRYVFKTSLIKTWTSRETISCRGLYKDESSYTAEGLLMFAVNKKSVPDAPDGAIAQRMRTFEFKKQWARSPDLVRDGVPLADPELGERLKTEASEAMLALLAEAWETRARRGVELTLPEMLVKVDDSRMTYSDPIGEWAHEALEPDHEAWEASEDLFNAARVWFARHGNRYAPSENKIAMALEDPPWNTARPDNPDKRWNRGKLARHLTNAGIGDPGVYGTPAYLGDKPTKEDQRMRDSRISVRRGVRLRDAWLEEYGVRRGVMAEANEPGY